MLCKDLHLAFICDGNRRWAVSVGKSKLEGHLEGAKTLERVIEYCKEQGARALTFYLFSTENFNRTAIEKKVIFDLFREYFKKFNTPETKEKYTISFLGNPALFPKDMQTMIADLEQGSHGPLKLNFCFGYGGRDEIVRACNKAINNGQEVTEETFAELLDMNDNPDIVVRTGGAKRISNFLLWQSAYSEWFFPETFWPALTNEHIADIVAQFKERTRNFGK